MYSRKSVWPRIEPWGTPALTGYSFWRLPIQNHLKPSITEKRRNKAKYLTWNSLRLKFVKKTCMPKPVKSLGYIKRYTAPVAPDLLQALAILSDTTVRRSVVYWEDLKPYWKSAKRPQSYYFSKTLLTTERRLTGYRCSCSHFSNILKYRDHQWNLSAIWKTRLL